MARCALIAAVLLAIAALAADLTPAQRRAYLRADGGIATWCDGGLCEEAPRGR